MQATIATQIAKGQPKLSASQQIPNDMVKRNSKKLNISKKDLKKKQNMSNATTKKNKIKKIYKLKLCTNDFW